MNFADDTRKIAKGGTLGFSCQIACRYMYNRMKILVVGIHIPKHSSVLKAQKNEKL